MASPDDGSPETPEHEAAVRPTWCGWCGGALVQPEGAGRPRRYCKQGCRQQAHIARKLAGAAGLAPDQVVVGRQEYEQLMERVTSLRAAVADLERVAPAADDVDDLRRSLDWLLSYASNV